MAALIPVFKITARVSGPVDVGLTPIGERRLIPILDGEVTGPRLQGRVLSGGTDYQLVRDAELSEIHARYVIETPTGARVYVENTGIRRGSAEDIARLRRGEIIPPDRIYFTTVPKFETAAPELLWLMRSIFICKGSRYPDRVELDVFEVG